MLVKLVPIQTDSEDEDGGQNRVNPNEGDAEGGHDCETWRGERDTLQVNEQTSYDDHVRLIDQSYYWTPEEELRNRPLQLLRALAIALVDQKS